VPLVCPIMPRAVRQVDVSARHTSVVGGHVMSSCQVLGGVAFRLVSMLYVELAPITEMKLFPSCGELVY
jgi:hypothetical protein